MIKAKPSDKKLITALLAGSFSQNPSVNFIISGNERRPERTAKLMDYSFELCMRSGEVWLSNDRRGCALLLFPHNKRMNFASLWLDLKLIFRAVGLKHLAKVLQRERIVAEKQPKGNRAYLWFIGVHPGFQKTGVGSALLEEVLVRCAELGLPIYLETSVPGNLPWYDRFGFKVYDELDLGYRLFFLAKTR